MDKMRGNIQVKVMDGSRDKCLKCQMKNDIQSKLIDGLTGWVAPSFPFKWDLRPNWIHSLLPFIYFLIFPFSSIHLVRSREHDTKYTNIIINIFISPIPHDTAGWMKHQIVSSMHCFTLWLQQHPVSLSLSLPLLHRNTP